MSKKEINFQGLFAFFSSKWFWPFFTGAFLGLGYSATQNILLSNIDIEQSDQANLSRSLSQEQSISFKTSSPTIKKDKISSRDRTINIDNNNSWPNEVLKVPKKINIIISDNSYLSFTIDFSEKINNMNQSAYKKNLAFFQEQDVDSLLKSLDKPKITISPRVKAD